MRDVYEELVKAAFVETYDIDEDFIDLRGITRSNYVEVLDKALQGKDLNAKTLILNFGTHGIEFRRISEDYFKPENRRVLYRVIINCCKPLCSVFVIEDGNVEKKSECSVSELIDEGDILCVGENEPSIFIHRNRGEIVFQEEPVMR